MSPDAVLKHRLRHHQVTDSDDVRSVFFSVMIRFASYAEEHNNKAEESSKSDLLLEKGSAFAVKNVYVS